MPPWQTSSPAVRTDSPWKIGWSCRIFVVPGNSGIYSIWKSDICLRTGKFCVAVGCQNWLCNAEATISEEEKDASSRQRTLLLQAKRLQKCLFVTSPILGFIRAWNSSWRTAILSRAHVVIKHTCVFRAWGGINLFITGIHYWKGQLERIAKRRKMYVWRKILQSLLWISIHMKFFFWWISNKTASSWVVASPLGFQFQIYEQAIPSLLRD